ncbi:hypothetical protein KAH94_04685, partial [bacterium]|nr:hypothetical protein [bacterium]
MNKKITIFALGATILVGTAYINADITSYLKYPWTRMKNYFNEAKKTQQIINNKLKNLKPQIKRAASLTNYIEKIKDKKIENLKNKHLEKMIDIKNPLIKEEQKLTQLEKQLKSIKNAPISTKREKRKALKTQKTNLTTEIKNEKKSIKTL